jgi:hypothetical protein
VNEWEKLKRKIRNFFLIVLLLSLIETFGKCLDSDYDSGYYRAYKKERKTSKIRGIRRIKW